MRFHFTEWGDPGAPDGPAAPRWQPVVALLGSRQPAPVRSLPRVRAGSAGPRRHRVEPRARLLDGGDGGRRAGVRRRPGARAADRLRTLDGRPGHAARRTATTRSRSGARPRRRRSRAVRQGRQGHRRLHRPQHRVRRPRRLPRERRPVRPVPDARAHRPHREVQPAREGRRQVRQQGGPPPAAGHARSHHPRRRRRHHLPGAAGARRGIRRAAARRRRALRRRAARRSTRHGAPTSVTTCTAATPPGSSTPSAPSWRRSTNRVRAPCSRTGSYAPGPCATATVRPTDAGGARCCSRTA